MISLMIFLAGVIAGAVVGLLVGANNPGLVKSASHSIEADAAKISEKTVAKPATPAVPPTSAPAPPTPPPKT